MLYLLSVARGGLPETRRHVTLRVVQELGAHPLRAGMHVHHGWLVSNASGGRGD